MKMFQNTSPDEVVVRTQQDFLQQAFDRLQTALQPARDAGYDISRIYLMLDEVLSNMYKHGYRRRHGEPIGVRLRIKGDRCEIEARDLAPTFDSALHARTRVLPAPETGAPGGRGLVIVHRMCESFEHESPPEGGNLVRLVMRLTAQQEEPVREARVRKTAKTQK